MTYKQKASIACAALGGSLVGSLLRQFSSGLNLECKVSAAEISVAVLLYVFINKIDE